MIHEVRKIILPRHHEVRATDVNMKRLGAVLTVAHENGLDNFESLLLLQGVGPRTIQSLTLVSEVIHGTPSRFTDPARFSFAHGGKDGHPFPVPLKVYDQTIETLKASVESAKLGDKDKSEAIKKLSTLALEVELHFQPKNFLADVIQQERDQSHEHGGMTVFGKAQPKKNQQLRLF